MDSKAQSSLELGRPGNNRNKGKSPLCFEEEMKDYVIGVVALVVSTAACISTPIVSLVGEDPEIARLLEEPQAPLPQNSAEASARRLYLALSQGDYEVSWALLSEKTKHILNQRAALAGTTGPELLQSNSLPQADGQIIKVNSFTSTHMLFIPLTLNIMPDIR